MAETIMYKLTSTPALMVGVTPNATIVLQLTEVGQQRITLTDPGELSQVIEEAMVTQARIAQTLYPLPAKIREVLAGAPDEGLLFPQIMAATQDVTWRAPEAYEITAELRNLEREGIVRRLIAQPSGVRWALTRRAAYRLVTGSPTSQAHEHSHDGQTLRHSHPGGREPHGYFDHPEDGVPAP